MSTAVAAAVADLAPDAQRSSHAKALYADLMGTVPEIRREFVQGLTPSDMRNVLAIARAEGGTPFALWIDDCVGFVEDVLGATLWSKSREVLESVANHKRTAVPSCFSSSKTFGAAQATLWWACVNPPGVGKVVTIAPIWRQVVRQMWPEIRAAHSRAGLPGIVDSAQMKMTDNNGLLQVVAYGLSAPPHNEIAVQGIHAPRILLIVDEGAGIARVIGKNLRAMMTGGGDTFTPSTGHRMLVIGNPPTDEEGTWFEELCTSDDVNTIRISAYDTPNLSGERAPRCRTCPAEMPAHSLAQHLVDREWVEETIAEFGEESAYVIAKVNAEFPKGIGQRVLPVSWLEACLKSDEPDGDGYVRLDYLGLTGSDDGLIKGESAPHMVKRGAWVRLGVDVAADGGDEFVIARTVGNLATIEHFTSGLANTNATEVAGRILNEIKRAERLRGALGTTQKVRVKVDAIGVGWGVVGILQAWASEGIHGAEIVAVNVGEGTNRDDEGAEMRPWRKRDEMWLALRDVVRPQGPELPGMLRLRVDKRTLAQLSAPTYATTSDGAHIKVESKDSMRGRGISSPDRAEAVLLSVYEPLVTRKGTPFRVIV